MSIDTHSPSLAGFRCEAVTTDTIAFACLHGRLVNITPVQSDDLDHGSSNRDDPAVLIGLTLASVRHGRSLNGLVPEPLMLRLRATADSGNAACRLLLDWLQNRNRDIDQSWNEPTGWASVTPPGGSSPPRRSPRERVLTQLPQPGAIGGWRRGRTRRREPVQDAHTEIIAAETGGRTDG